MPSQHKPGSLKQSNKKHKGVSGKRSQKRALGAGKVETSSSASLQSKESGKSSKSEGSRLKRINQSVQLRNNKKADVWLAKRIGSSSGPPRTVALIPLSAMADTSAFLNSLLSMEISDISYSSDSRVVYGSLKKHRSKFAFIQSASPNVMDAVEVARVADIIVFVANAPTQLGNSAVSRMDDGAQIAALYGDMIDEDGLSSIAALRSLGFPALMCAVNGLTVGGPSAVQVNAKRLRELTRFVEYSITADVRICDAADIANAARQLSTMPCGKEIGWRSRRSYLVADKVEVASQNENGNTIVLSGFIRGNPLYIHSLAHVCGVGTTRIARVEVFGATHEPLSSRWTEMSIHDSSTTATSSSDYSVFNTDASLQDSLVMSATGDVLAGEQTWPSEEEMATNGDMDVGRNRRPVNDKSVPAGMSSYQADWYVDEEGNFDNEAANEDDEGIGEGIIDDINATKRRQEADEIAFPDEMDTPDDVPARVRFARYRALQSFRSSPWNPKENLPPSYASIFEFEDFSGMQRRILGEVGSVQELQHANMLSSKKKTGGRSHANSMDTTNNNAGAMEIIEEEGQDGQDEEDDDEVAAMDDDNHNAQQPPTAAASSSASAISESAFGRVMGAEDYIAAGQYVRIWLDNVPSIPQQLLERDPSSGKWKAATFFSLLPHENKLSVLNFSAVQRVESNTDDPVKSKDELLFMSGFRSFVGRPIFSEDNLNCEKNKMERFLLPHRFSMATVFGPITYTPCPILIFKKYPAADGSGAGSYRLLATGMLGSVDPDRIILKKVILTGHPIRVKKRFAVVKHLFHEPNDVRWFKPAELVTKHGLRGHITEPVGTHGLLKAQFNNPITQNDTIMLVLYKRVYPKFPVNGIELM